VAGLYLSLGAQFLAAIQVLIYIGAILVLIVFAVTLTRDATDTEKPQSNGFAIPVVLAALLLVAALAGALLTAPHKGYIALDTVSLIPGVKVTDISAIGLVLFQQYLLPFEIASVLLLAAMVGAIALARKEHDAKEITDAPAAEKVRETAGVR
jgi:NADH-quinone oxidoreductase subunit J